ncbi:TPA: hypothetical protein OOF66_004005 [Morganella morganii]|nr:hypothetical protein [Morganella morganii]HCR4051892.1 hypothetical protein [Morganella morganii]
MEFKGTPGPWVHAGGNSLTETIGGAINGDGKTLCLILGKGIGKEKATANAKLMAAAPEMIDFLLRINGAYYLSDKHQSELKSVINKALGRE